MFHAVICRPGPETRTPGVGTPNSSRIRAHPKGSLARGTRCSNASLGSGREVWGGGGPLPDFQPGSDVRRN